MCWLRVWSEGVVAAPMVTGEDSGEGVRGQDGAPCSADETTLDACMPRDAAEDVKEQIVREADVVAVAIRPVHQGRPGGGGGCVLLISSQRCVHVSEGRSSESNQEKFSVGGDRSIESALLV